MSSSSIPASSPSDTDSAPLFIFRVQFSDGFRDLPVYPNLSPIELAESFCQANGLDKSKVASLASAIQSQAQSAAASSASSTIFDRLYRSPPRFSSRRSQRVLTEYSNERAEREAQEAAQLTFKPTISQRAVKSVGAFRRGIPVDRERRRQQEKALQAILDEQQAELSFKPAINPVSQILAANRSAALQRRENRKREAARAAELAERHREAVELRAAPSPKATQAERRAAFAAFLDRSQRLLERQVERAAEARDHRLVETRDPVSGQTTTRELFKPEISKKSEKLAQTRKFKTATGYQTSSSRSSEDRSPSPSRSPSASTRSLTMLVDRALAKAQRLFSLLDLDSDGFIDRSDIERVQLEPILPEADSAILSLVIAECDRELEGELPALSEVPDEAELAWELNERDFAALFVESAEKLARSGVFSSREIFLSEPTRKALSQTEPSAAETMFRPRINPKSVKLDRLAAERERIRTLNAEQIEKQKDELAKEIELLSKSIEMLNQPENKSATDSERKAI